jgi:hypothetical protein
LTAGYRQRIDGVEAMGPRAFERQFVQSVTMFTAIVTLIGLIGGVLGLALGWAFTAALRYE